MAEILLKDSTICRLCAEDNVNGEFLFTDDSELSTMINRYLPVKVIFFLIQFFLKLLHYKLTEQFFKSSNDFN